MNANKASEQIQSRFVFNDAGEVIGCPNRFMSDILGSDWACGLNLDNSVPVEKFYTIVRERAERKYGALPY